MKKLICLILVLTFCACLACPVFASEAEDDFVSSPGTEPGCNHVFQNGSCIYCGMLEDNPQTGDTSNIGMWMIVMVASAACLVTLNTVYRKKTANQ